MNKTVLTLMGVISGIPFSTYANSDLEKPNVVVIEVDDLHYKCLGYMGNKVVKTPNLDKLAASGTVFNNCIVQGVACAPSRNSLISGSYPHNTGIYLNQSLASLKNNGWTFPKALQRAGVYTSLIGKNHFRAHGFKIDGDAKSTERNKIVSQQLGFDYSVSTLGKVVVSKTLIDSEKDPYAKSLHEKNVYEKLVKAYNKKPLVFPLGEEDYLDSFISNRSVDWLKNRKSGEKPFFMWIDYSLPHPPMDAPAKYRGMYDDAKLPKLIPANKKGLPKCMSKGMKAKGKSSYLRGYYELVTMMDDQVGKIMSAIDDAGLRENTIIVFFSDHGSMIGNHGLYAKKYFYKDVLNSPLIIAHPTLGKGKTIDQCVELVDVSKTMLDIYNAKEEDVKKSHGESLLPLISGEGNYDKEYVFAEHNDGIMIQNNEFKYMRFKKDIDVLFDLKNDPDEMTNVVKKHPELVKALSAKIDQWLLATGPVEKHVEK